MTHSNASEQRERELKFEVPPGWQLPDTSGLAPGNGSVRSSSVSLENTYYDTEHHDLLASGVTLRRRVGGEDAGWHLKLPDADARLELLLPPSGRGVPRLFQQLTVGVRRSATLRPVAILRTERAVRLLLDETGAPLAELVVDDVAATRTGEAATVTTWREVEVELKDGDEKVLKRAARWLRKAGARPADYGSKLARALDAPAAAAPAPDSVLGAVGSYLAEQYEAILRGDIDLRREQEVIHKTRVGTRRYRTVLRVFADLFDADRARALDAELKWYASLLGQVRDIQVLGDRLRDDVEALPPELVLGPVSARLETTLISDLADARKTLDAAMRSRRYFDLLDELRTWSADPPVVAMNEPADALARYLRQSDKRFRRRMKHAKRFDDGDPAKNEALHHARKAAKRARYTAELCEPYLGKQARAAVGQGKSMQDKLGKRQDAVVAVEFLRRIGAAAGVAPGENGFTFGILLAHAIRRAHLDRGGA